MTTLLAVALGAFSGARLARKHGGKAFDMMQYSAVRAIIFGLAAMILSVLVARLI